MLNHLICPQCRCPLSPPSGAATAVSCPRCMTWVEIDPQCLGSCMSCHKAHQEQISDCVEVAVESPSKKPAAEK